MYWRGTLSTVPQKGVREIGLFAKKPATAAPEARARAPTRRNNRRSFTDLKVCTAALRGPCPSSGFWSNRPHPVRVRPLRTSTFVHSKRQVRCGGEELEMHASVMVRARIMMVCQVQAVLAPRDMRSCEVMT